MAISLQWLNDSQLPSIFPHLIQFPSFSRTILCIELFEKKRSLSSSYLYPRLSLFFLVALLYRSLFQCLSLIVVSCIFITFNAMVALIFVFVPFDCMLIDDMNMNSACDWVRMIVFHSHTHTNAEKIDRNVDPCSLRILFSELSFLFQYFTIVLFISCILCVVCHDWN